MRDACPAASAVCCNATFDVSEAAQQNLPRGKWAAPIIVAPVVVMHVSAAASRRLTVPQRKNRCLSGKKLLAGNTPDGYAGIVWMPDRHRVVGTTLILAGRSGLCCASSSDQPETESSNDKTNENKPPRHPSDPPYIPITRQGARQASFTARQASEAHTVALATAGGKSKSLRRHLPWHAIASQLSQAIWRSRPGGNRYRESR